MIFYDIGLPAEYPFFLFLTKNLSEQIVGI